MNDAVILGWGTIGKATANAFNITKYYSRSSQNVTLDEAAKCRYIFVCLPTPVENGQYVTKDITALIEALQGRKGFSESIIIIRSTVYSGYNKYLQKTFGITNIVSNPEFLSEDTAIKDANNPDLVVIGSDDVNSREAVLGLYRGRFKSCTPIVTDSITAELIKISLNAFFTIKVVFANEIFDYSQTIGANYSTVQKVLENHPWGSKGHFTPFHKGGRGAGGKCLFKDSVAIANYSRSDLFRQVCLINQKLLEDSQKI